ncbi:uncharacterized protein [Antedon mediterranea]|uniref:uncharacterized protein n=1 Tax=Antedon mediterranea TaxID=105859 RepID=UPI003AF60FF0
MGAQVKSFLYWILFTIQLVSCQRLSLPNEFLSGKDICDTFMSALGKVCDCSGRLLHLVPSYVPDDCFILDLSANEISNIERHTFVRFQQLERLYLNSNNIQAIHPHAFDGLSNLTVIDLANNKLLEIPPRTFTDTRYLQVLNLTHNNLRVPPTIGHLNRLQELIISHNSLRFVTSSAWTGLIALRILNISSNHLVKLYADSFKGLRYVVTLDLSHNSLNTIQNKAFSSLVRLEVLKLNDNQLTKIDENAFLDLSMMTRLDLQNNQLFSIPLSFQNGFSSLKHLNLQGNKIVEISINSFKHLSNLNVLNLNDNRLQIVAGRSFLLLPQLVMLDLRNNQIEVLPADVFIGLRTLKVLDLRNNRLKNVGKIMHPLFNLETVLLSDNMISYIPVDTFDQCARIIEIRIDHNNLTYIPEGIGHSKTGSQTLKGLSLADNPIKEISATSFGRFSSLQLLRLSNTQLNILPIDAFTQMPRLLQLWLDGNQLTTLHKGMLGFLPRLTAIHLQGNLWDCQCDLHYFWSYMDSRGISSGIDEKPVCHSPPILSGVTLEVAFAVKECLEDNGAFSVMEIEILIPIIVGAIVLMFLIVACICITAGHKNPIYAKTIPSDGNTARAMSLPSFASLNSMSSSSPLTLPPRNGTNSTRYHNHSSIFHERKLHRTTRPNLDRQGSYLSINVPTPGGEYASPYAQPYSQPRDHPSWFQDSDQREDIY